ncbi:MAG: cobalamin-dependent protein [Planctomycetes bacterium]|nr:cobalamin-dependent protein [Planctomycetota bacterium]
MRVHPTTLPNLDAHGQFVAALVGSAKKAHAAGAVLRVADANPGAVAAFGAAGFLDLKTHAEGLLDHLIQALTFARPALYADQVGWLKQAFVARGIDTTALALLLAALRDELAAELPPEAAQTARAVAEAGLRHFESAPAETPSPLSAATRETELAKRYLLAVFEGRRLDAIRIAEDAIAAGLSVPDLYSKVLGPAQVEIGRMWQRGEVHVAEEHLSSRITEQVMSIVNARMPRAPRNGQRVLITSANGDLHDIGLRMVADHFEMQGWEVVFLGASTPAEDVAAAVRDFEVDLVAVAAKLVLHVRTTAELIAAVRGSVAGRHLPILVGGYPFQIVPDLWRLVGADGVATSAAQAVEVGERLVVRPPGRSRERADGTPS